MRIAYITKNIDRLNGQGRVCFELARHALRKGHHVSLFTDFVEPELISIGAQWIPIHPRLGRASLLTDRESVFLANRAFKKLNQKFDLVHAFGYSFGGHHDVNSAQFIHRTWGRSPVHPIKGRKTPYAFYHWLYTYLNARWEQVAYRNARLIVACSPMVRSELIGGGVPAAKLRVQYNGVDLQEFGLGACPRSEIGLPQGVPILLFAGDIRTPRKNLGAVLRAMKEIPEVHLAVVGGVSGSPYPTMAEEIGVGSRTHFLGFRDDMAAIMGAVDMFVFPSEYEPFGIVVLEAMASRLPVITASTVGAADLVSTECGIVIRDPSDVSALAEAIRKMVAFPVRRKEMGEAGRELAHHHSWANVADAYMGIYEEALRGSRPLLG